MRDQQDSFQRQFEQQAQMFEKILERVVAPAAVGPSGPSAAAVQNDVKMSSMKELVAAGSVEDDERCRAMKENPKPKQQPTADQWKEIRAITAEFKDKLHKFMNVEEKLESIKNKQSLLNEEKRPPGLKPYAAPWEYTAMDEVSSLAGQNISIPVPEKTTCAELRQLLWNTYHSLTAAVDIEILTGRRDELQKDSSMKSYLQELRAKLHADALGVEKYTAVVKVPPDVLPGKDDDPCYIAAVKRYTDLVSNKAAERRKKDLEREREERKTERLKKTVLEMTPDQVIESKIKELVDKTKTNNGQTPGAAQGHNQKSKGKGKGTSKQSDKGKGKGKGKSPDKGKGKGGKNGSKGSGKLFWRQGGKGATKGKARRRSRTCYSDAGAETCLLKIGHGCADRRNYIRTFTLLMLKPVVR